MKKSDSATAQFLHPEGSLGRRLPWRELLVVLALGCLIGTGWISFRAMNQLASAEHWEKHTYEVILKFEQLMSSMKDAETGQRGYLLTGRDDYLAPYVKATMEVDKLHKALMLLTADNPAQQRRLAEIASLTQARMQILERIIDLRREQGFDAAVKVVRMGQSKAIMDAVRQHIAAAQAEEERLLAERTAIKVREARGTTRTLSLAGIVGGTLLVVMLVTLYRETAHCKRLAAALQRHQVNLEYLVQTRTAELGKSEARLKTLIEHAPAALAMLDRNLCYLAASRRWREESRLGDQDIFGRPHGEVFPETPEHWKEAYRRALAGEVLRGDAERFERADGSVRWFSWEIRPWHDETKGSGRDRDIHEGHHRADAIPGRPPAQPRTARPHHRHGPGIDFLHRPGLPLSPAESHVSALVRSANRRVAWAVGTGGHRERRLGKNTPLDGTGQGRRGGQL